MILAETGALLPLPCLPTWLNVSLQARTLRRRLRMSVTQMRLVQSSRTSTLASLRRMVYVAPLCCKPRPTNASSRR